VANCRALKAAGLAHRCFIYHNMELGLEWLESQRAVMYDTPAYFLQYQQGNPHGVIPGTVYNEAREEGDQYFWVSGLAAVPGAALRASRRRAHAAPRPRRSQDFRNVDAAAYFVSSVAASVADPAVDGTFTDDVTGVPAEHEEVQKNTGMSDAEIAALQYATQQASQNLITTLTLAGKYNYQAFGAQDGVNGGPTKGTCAAWVRERCAPAYQGRPMFIGMDNAPANANQTVAAFLVTRPPHGYIGWGWESDDRQWNDIFYLQAGTPTGLCVESPAGVFSRAWMAGTAVIDCNQWTASLPFPALAH